MNIAMLSSEANPFIKTGGLADVVYSLSRELVEMGHRVYVFLPYYSEIGNKGKDKIFRPAGNVKVKMGWRNHEADLHVADVEGITYCLIGNYFYFVRPQIYGYGDDGERFAFFSLACVEAMRKLHVDPEIVHCHDWQVGMVPALIKTLYAQDKIFRKAKTVLTIHNPAFKGYIAPGSLNDLYNLPMSLYEDGTARLDGQVSTLKCGIMVADKITTVSPTHRGELLDPWSTHGLSGVLLYRERDFVGIVNGLDEGEFDPAKDAMIPFPFGVANVGEKKKKDREAACASFGLRDKGGPMFALVSRLTYQKGCDLLLHVLREALARGAMLLLVGSGEYGIEQGFEALRRDFPDQISLYIGYSNARAHVAYAASDFFLMPSLFEPCGIGQLIAEKYGSIPVARDTGGLHDTIVDYRGDNLEEATGILFRDYNDDGMRYAISQAERLYQDKTAFAKVQRNAMEADHSWKKSAEAYEALYHSIAR